MGLQLPLHTGACEQQGGEQMEQTIPVCGRLTPRCWGLGVRKMADCKHLNNNTAHMLTLLHQEGTTSFRRRINLKNTMEYE